MDYVLVTWLVAEPFGAVLCGGGMGAGLAAVGADPGDGGLFHPARSAAMRSIAGCWRAMCRWRREEGTTQAIFPEGGLVAGRAGGRGEDGAVGLYRAGLSMPGGRDVVFVPVGLAYDRVLEDRVLVEAAADGVRGGFAPGRWRSLRFVCAYALAQAARAVSGLWHGGGGLWRAGVAARLSGRTARRPDRRPWARI